MHEAIARDQGRIARVQPDEMPPAPQPSSNNSTEIEPTPTPGPVENGATHDESHDVPAIGSEPGPQSHVTSQAPEPTFFSTHQYRIDRLEFLDADGCEVTSVKFGSTFRIRVTYECLLPELPEYSCGLAVAFNRLSDFEAAMYFNTNYPHSDEEIRSYFDAPYRQTRARRGTIEAILNPLQLKAGQYYVSLGILPNQPGPHEFYEYRHCHYVITVLPNGFDEPAVFYPMVEWRTERMS
jgi:hypothetical protein